MSDSTNDEVQVLTTNQKVEELESFIKDLDSATWSETNLNHRNNLWQSLIVAKTSLLELQKNPENFPHYSILVYGTGKIYELW